MVGRDTTKEEKKAVWFFRSHHDIHSVLFSISANGICMCVFFCFSFWCGRLATCEFSKVKIKWIFQCQTSIKNKLSMHLLRICFLLSVVCKQSNLIVVWFEFFLSKKILKWTTINAPVVLFASCLRLYYWQVYPLGEWYLRFYLQLTIGFNTIYRNDIIIDFIRQNPR